MPGDDDASERQINILELANALGRHRLLSIAVHLNTVMKLTHSWMDPDVKEALRYIILKDEAEKYVQSVTQIFSLKSVVKSLIDGDPQTDTENSWEKFFLVSGGRLKDYSGLKKNKVSIQR